MKTIHPMLTPEQLKSILHYDPETGKFTWLASRGRAPSGAVAGCVNGYGYRVIAIGGKQYREHRLAWLYMTGEWPPEQVDHIHPNRADNRWCNLRKATQTQNNHNARISAASASSAKGVRWVASRCKWLARVMAEGRRYQKYFRTQQEAIDWVSAQRASLHGEFANHG